MQTCFLLPICPQPKYRWKSGAYNFRKAANFVILKWYGASIKYWWPEVQKNRPPPVDIIWIVVWWLSVPEGGRFDVSDLKSPE